MVITNTAARIVLQRCWSLLGPEFISVRFWDPSSLLSSGYRGSFLRG